MREVIEYANAAACLMLLIAAFPVARVMRATGGIWGYRLLMWALLVGFACQAMGPWLPFVAYVPLPVAIVNWTVLIGVVVWRREAWVFARCKFGPPPDPKENRHRRRADVEAIGQRELRHVAGGVKE